MRVLFSLKKSFNYNDLFYSDSEILFYKLAKQIFKQFYRNWMMELLTITLFSENIIYIVNKL